MRKKTNDQFLKELKQINERIIPEEEYNGAKTEIRCRCAECGYVWPVKPNNLLNGCGCPKCSGTMKKSNDVFLKELLAKDSNIEPLEEYQNNVTDIQCKCKICGCIFKTKPKYLLKSKSSCCPQCGPKERGKVRRKTNETFIQELLLINPDVLPLEPYISSSEKIKCQCKKCGHIWFPLPNSLLFRKSGCPKCDHSATSVIEQIILRAFSIGVGDNAVLSRDKKTIGKELDVLIPDLKLAIEFGAWFWHKNKIKNDREKQIRCKEKGIHLITILEKCPDEINEQLVGDFRLFKESLSGDKDYHFIKQILKEIFSDYNLPFSNVAASWNIIVQTAIQDAQRRNEEDFIRLLNNINPDILVSNYTRADAIVECKCKVCGYEWSPLASSLLSAHGCSKCAKTKNGRKRRLTNEEFVARLAEVHKDIIPLEPYIKSDIKILCKCKVCGRTWTAKPANLLFGRGCRKCSRAHIAMAQSKPVRCIETGVCYNSIAEVERLGIYNLTKCLKGHQETAGGYHWEYVEK